MTSGFVRRMAAVAAIGTAVASLSACSEKIVYRDQPAFPPPPAAAGTFLGYQNVNTKQTICGTCHAGHQEAWQGTAHASAWADLQASGGATAECEQCHTVGQNGNRVESKNVGWTATKDKRYTDVQCESCHGPGGGHVANPEVVANRPLASMNVDPTLASTDGCGACHNDSHHPYVEEWAKSPHGAMPFTYEDPAEAGSILGTSTSNGCGINCHSGQGALKNNFGVNTAMLEQGGTITSTTAMKLTCTVCHDPHSKTNDGQLRRPIGSNLVLGDNTSNLCSTCHNRNFTISATTWRGPHSPEAQLVLGTATVGWRPQSMGTATIVGTHGSPDGNPTLCATCHVSKMATGSGATTWNSTGHLFLATPCLDSNGRPSAGTCEESARTFKACTGSGCHASETVARSLTATSELRLNSKLATLKGLLENLTAIPCSVFKEKTAPVNAARGARFNYLLAVGHVAWAENDACTDNSGSEPVYYRALPAPVVDPGSAIHNPFLMDALLQASIDTVRAKYYPGTFTRYAK